MTPKKLLAEYGMEAPFRRAVEPAEVALFMPPAEDSSCLVANHLAKCLVEQTSSINLRIFLVDQKKDPRVEQTPALKEKRFLHGDLLRDVVFPFQIGKRVLIYNGIALAPDLLAERYKGRVFVQKVSDLNDSAFIDEHISGNNALRMGFSVRNLNRFEQPIIDAFNKGKGAATLINSHPAPLPGIRGLEGPFWTRVLDGYDEYTTTLHVVEFKFDSGPILDYHARAISGRSLKRPVTRFLQDAAPDVARMIYEQIHLRVLKKGHHSGLTIQQGDVGYKTLPTQQEIDQARQKGIILSDAKEQIAWLSNNFASGRHQTLLERALRRKYAEFQKENLQNNDPTRSVLDAVPEPVARVV